MMLSLAIKARIPVIHARTTDLINLKDVLQHIAPGLEIVEANTSIPTTGNLIYTTSTKLEVSRSDYDALIEDERVLLLINQEAPTQFAFDVGEVPVPKELVEDLLQAVVKKGRVAELLPCFNGLTLKGMSEVIRLATAKDKALTAKGVTQLRSQITGKQPGLAQVDLALPLYICPPELKAWVDKNKRYFLEGTDERLVPRGILMNGEPGVGKSQGAKYIANEFGVPLYRLDLSTALSKWVSESEANFGRVLSALDQEEPGILLIDEAEKIFAETQDEGITARLLSQLLWWMAEHRSRVLTVMTTNNMSALPKELYRAGRVDKTLTINKPKPKEANVLAVATLRQFFDPTMAQIKVLSERLREYSKLGTQSYVEMSHAEVVQVTYDLIKEKGWTL